MEKILLMAFLILNFGTSYAQSSKTVFNQFGVKISYRYQKIGTEVNNETGVRFSKYNLTSSIENTSSKYFDIKSSIRFDYMDAMQLVQNESDKNFIREKSMQSDLDHVFCGQDCNNYPQDGIAHLFVLCPNSISYCEGTFVIPEDNAGQISINWSQNVIEIMGQEVSNNSTPNNNSNATTPQFSDWKKINSSNCDIGIEYKTKREERYQLNYQLWFYYKVRNTGTKNISFDFNLTSNGKIEFSQPHVLSPGGEAEFMHKMEKNNIDGISATKVLNTVTKKNLCDDGPDNSGNSNNTTTNPSSGSSMQELIDRWNELCQKANSSNNPAVIAASRRSCLTSNKDFEETEANKNMVRGRIKDLEQAFETNNTFEEEQDKAKKEEEERLQARSKVLTAKTSKFTDLIEDGDDSYNEENYDKAISFYQQARNLYSGTIEPEEKEYASEAVPLADAKIAAAQKAKEDAARRQRLKAQKERDAREDVAYTSLASSTIGLMAMLTDKYTNKGFSGKLQAGLGYERTPLITNQTSGALAQTSKADNATYPTTFLALKFELFNNKAINVYTRGFMSFGIHALETGISGGHLNTGFDGGLQFWFKKRTKFKLFAEAANFVRIGDKSTDEDAVNGGSTTTDNLQNGEYDYKVIRYGGGPMLHFRKRGRETWIKAGLFKEQISFAKESSPTNIFLLSANIGSTIILDLTYSQNYPIAGLLSFPAKFTAENQHLFSVKVIRQGNLW
jgi:hypothetical protein